MRPVCAALLLLVACSTAPKPIETAAEYLPFNEPGNRPHVEVVSGYDAQHYKIEVRIDDKSPEIWGRTTVALTLTEERKDSVSFHAEGLKFRMVKVGGVPVLFKAKEGRVVVPLSRLAAKGEALTVEAEYTATPRHGLFRIAPDEGYPTKPWMIWTQGETEYNRHWFPCWDLPNDKATSEVLATVRSPYTTMSNGSLIGTKEENGWKTFHWRQEQPHASYLVTLVAGEFERFDDEVVLASRKVPLQAYVAKGKYDAADVKRTFAKTGAMVKWFSEKTGVDYPWTKYAQVCVWDFIWGGMENTSATTLHQFTVIPARGAMDRDSEGLISHELAHQWFGDYATCRTWSETWLNEGFATYFTALWFEHDRGADAYAESMWGNFASAIGGEYQRPIVTDRYTDPLDMFDNHSYGKGACFLHMLRSVVGDDAWWKGVKLYLTDRALKSATTRDLQAAMESASGAPLDWLFDEWLFKAGFPEFEVTTTWDEGTKALTVVVQQKQKIDEHHPIFRMPAEVEIDGRMYLTQIERSPQELTFALEAKPSMVLFDPRGNILKKLAAEGDAEAVLQKSAHVWSRRWAIDQLREKKESSSIAQLKRVLLEEKNPMLQVAAAQALGKMDADALIPAAKLADARVRWAVYEGLGDWAKRDDVAALLERAGNEDASPNCRATAWLALGKRGKEAVETLTKAAEKYIDDEWVLPGILSGLVEAGDERAVAILISATTYGIHPWIRQRATWALGETGRRRKPRGEDPLGHGVPGLLDEAYLTRSGVRKRLLELLGDPAFRIRGDATAALKDIGDLAAADLLEKQAAKEFDGRQIVRMEKAARAIRERVKR